MKVLDAIKTITLKERESFIKYINSPYFNQNETLLKLFYELEKFNENKSKKENIYLKSTNEQSYDASRFRKLCHELTEHILNFKRIEKFQSDVRESPAYDISVVKENDFKAHYNIILKKGQLYFDSTPVKNSQFYLKKYNFGREKFDLNSEYDKQILLEKSPQEFFGLMEEAIESLDTYFLIERTRITNTYFQFYKLLKKENYPEYHRLVMDYIIAHLQYPHGPLIELYINTYQLLINDEYVINVNEFSKLLKESLVQTNPKEVSDLYVHYTNHAIRQILKGNRDYFPILFELYKVGMRLKVLPISNPTEYRNIAAAACQIKEFDWALEFIEEYKMELPEDQRESAYSFTKARIYGNMKDWPSVLSTLRNVEYEDMGYMLNSKLFIIMAYYELDEYDALDSFIKSFKVFLRRRRNIPTTRKNAFYGFANILGHLMKAYERRDVKRLKKALLEIENNKAIPNQDWLKEKIQELETIMKK